MSDDVRKELLGLILDTAAGGVQADRGTVFLLSDDRKELWSRVVQGEQTLEIRLPVGQGIAGSVAVSGETIRIDYLLWPTSDGWRIIDVYLKGIYSELALTHNAVTVKAGVFYTGS